MFTRMMTEIDDYFHFFDCFGIHAPDERPGFRVLGDPANNFFTYFDALSRSRSFLPPYEGHAVTPESRYCMLSKVSLPFSVDSRGCY